MKKQPTPKPNAKRNSKPSPQPGVKHRPIAGEKTKRIEQIVGLILSGARRGEILEFVRVQWGLGQAQTDNYISEANANIKAESAKANEAAYDKAIARRLNYIKQARASNDIKTALDADKDLCKLQDLYPDPRVKVVDWKSEFIALLKTNQVTPEQVREVLGDEADEIIIAAGIAPIPTGTNPQTSNGEPTSANP